MKKQERHEDDILELKSQLAILRDCQGVCSHELEAGKLRAELAQAKQEREDFSAIGHERIIGLEQEIEKLKSELRDERALTDEDYSLIEIENNRLRAELANLKGALAADDERLANAAVVVWGEHIWGCDTPEHMVDLIQELRAELAQAKSNWSYITKQNLDYEEEIGNLRAELVYLQAKVKE